MTSFPLFPDELLKELIDAVVSKTAMDRASIGFLQLGLNNPAWAAGTFLTPDDALTMTQAVTENVTLIIRSEPWVYPARELVLVAYQRFTPEMPLQYAADIFDGERLIMSEAPVIVRFSAGVVSIYFLGKNFAFSCKCSLTEDYDAEKHNGIVPVAVNRTIFSQ